MNCVTEHIKCCCLLLIFIWQVTNAGCGLDEQQAGWQNEPHPGRYILIESFPKLFTVRCPMVKSEDTMKHQKYTKDVFLWCDTLWLKTPAWHSLLLFIFIHQTTSWLWNLLMNRHDDHGGHMTNGGRWTCSTASEWLLNIHYLHEGGYVSPMLVWLNFGTCQSDGGAVIDTFTFWPLTFK